VIPIPVNYYCSSIVIIYTTHPNIHTHTDGGRGENKRIGKRMTGRDFFSSLVENLLSKEKEKTKKKENSSFC
jgi:hypothetical protein